jgi:phosphatidate cytidylyltransferase
LVRALSVLPLLAPVIFGIPLVFRKDLRMGLASSAASVFGVLYIAASLSLLIVLRSDPAQSVLIIFVLFSVWAGDTAAYYVGRTIGRHKLAPVVSPNKSWEGAVASVVASVAVAFLVLSYTSQLSGYLLLTGEYHVDRSVLVFHQPGIWHCAVLGVLANVAAQFGDLFESALKRGAEVKDSGALLPGHGGVLDRIDALLFAIPVVWYYAQLTGSAFLSVKINP